ncbi:M23 family metallopeptidase [Miniimonas arenae]|uniref:M23 family metallopeptidase n=1 Tax=Miniimonas arenae TaxID=676201 RepID=A0A5C5BE40_9MICO|nr:M23 family metallopeptidase [Miniimonas arenae]TNU76071.1 M23 family metallopeptidase [Miniimonas arenae]
MRATVLTRGVAACLAAAVGVLVAGGAQAAPVPLPVSGESALAYLDSPIAGAAYLAPEHASPRWDRTSSARGAADSDGLSPMDYPLEEDSVDPLAEAASWWTPATATGTAPPPPAPLLSAVDAAVEQAAYRLSLAEAGVEVSELGWVHPLPNGKFASPFGFRGAIAGLTSAGLHNGVDLSAPLGYPIRAAAAGTVVYVGNGSRELGLSGWVVAIDHGDGVVTAYNHMAQAGVLVTLGQQVREGEIVALVGTEGRSTGPHLHFSVHVNGVAVDPVPFMLARGVDLRSGRTVTPVPLTADYLAAQAAFQANLVAIAMTPLPPVPVVQAPSPTPTPTPDPSPSPTPTPEPTASPTPEPSPSPSPSPSASPSPSPGPSATPHPSTTPTPTPSPTPEPSPQPSPSPSPTATPTPAATATPEPAGTQPSASAAPSAAASDEPTSSAAVAGDPEPTAAP